jgi:hypothetical protein
MNDRQDIDALLISALYGELTPADEARLNTHLESHPADRAVLEGMTQARTALHESRILTVQLEPPQSISALLLQEAARRAPKPVAQIATEEVREGWFARFVRSFASRPMMAAAAMLVLAVGVIGTMKVRSSSFEATADHPNLPALASGRDVHAAPAAESAPTPKDTFPNAGSSIPVQLSDDDGRSRNRDHEDRAHEEKQVKQDAKATVAETARPLPPVTAPRQDLDSIAVRTRPPTPKPIDPDVAKKESRDSVIGITESTSDEGKNRGAGGASAAEPPRAPATPVTPPSPAADRSVRPPVSERSEQVENTGAARNIHREAVAAARANDCAKAGKLATELEEVAPGYYQSQLQTDRELKKCLPHINAEHERALSMRRGGARDQSKQPAQKAPAPAPSKEEPSSNRR